MSEIKLKPCPFCGGNEFRIRYTEGEETWYWVHCEGCDTESGVYNTKEQAIEAWNTRNPMERIVEQLEEEIKENPDCSLREYRSGIYKAIEIVKAGGVNE